jgi:hypothetical protein
MIVCEVSRRGVGPDMDPRVVVGPMHFFVREVFRPEKRSKIGCGVDTKRCLRTVRVGREGQGGHFRVIIRWQGTKGSPG